MRLLERYLNEYQAQLGRGPGIKDLCNFVAIPNHKADFNNQNGFGSDYIGHNWKYPEASYSEREAIWKDHLTYTQCFYYFITHDHKLPAGLRAETSQWGLSKDEFADTDHWPHQLYVREARRMVGDYVMRQSDTVSERTKSDSIGMGSYNIDSHNTQRVAMPDGNALNEGDVQFPVEPYEISYRSITPKRAEAENLLVTVCLSATHVAYCSIRMEPQYMILGQAAGTAASLAVNSRQAGSGYFYLRFTAETARAWSGASSRRGVSSGYHLNDAQRGSCRRARLAMMIFSFLGGISYALFIQSFGVRLAALALPVLASSQAADYVYRIDGPASVSALRVTGASAEWSATIEDGGAIEAVAEKLPAVKNGAVHLVLAPGNATQTVELNAESGLVSDWSGHGKLVFHLCNASEFMIPFTLTIRDAAGADVHGQSSMDVQSAQSL